MAPVAGVAGSHCVPKEQPKKLYGFIVSQELNTIS